MKIHILLMLTSSLFLFAEIAESGTGYGSSYGDDKPSPRSHSVLVYPFRLWNCIESGKRREYYGQFVSYNSDGDKKIKLYGAQGQTFTLALGSLSEADNKYLLDILNIASNSGSDFEISKFLPVGNPAKTQDKLTDADFRKEKLPEGLTPIAKSEPNPFDQFDPVQSPTKKTVLVDPYENKSQPVTEKKPWEEYYQPSSAPAQDPAILPAGYTLDKPPSMPALTADQVKEQQFRDRVGVLRKKAYALGISSKFNLWPKGDNGEQYLDELQMLIDNELGKKTSSTSDHFIAWGIGGLILVGLFIGGLMLRVLKAINAKSASVIPSALPIAKTDDAIKFNCPNCSRHLECPEDMLGTQINCPACNKLILTPKPPSIQEALPVYSPPAPFTTQQKDRWWWGFAWRTGLISALTFIAIAIPCAILFDSKIIAQPNVSAEQGIALIRVGIMVLMYGVAFGVMKRMLSMKYKHFHVVLQSNVISTSGTPTIVDATWNRAVTVWWGFAWRHILISVLLEWVIGLWGLSPSTLRSVEGVLALGVQYIVVCYILGKKFKDFRIMATPRNRM